MSMDWNWFFTSVSQSAAAIVGIFGAFIVTKILTNQTAFAGNKVKAQELISEGKRLIDIASHKRFDWYNDQKLKEAGFLMRHSYELGHKIPAKDFYKQIKSLPYANKEKTIFQLGLIAAEWLELNKTQIVTNSKRLLEHEFNNATLQAALTEERKNIDEVYTEALHLTRVVSNFHATTSQHPESSQAITSSLRFVFGLFVVGVIYPLSFLPVPLNWEPALTILGIPTFWISFRGVLLLLIFLMFTYMLWMFYKMNNEMKYPVELLQELEQYKSLSTYSEFFSNREANEKS